MGNKDRLLAMSDSGFIASKYMEKRRVKKKGDFDPNSKYVKKAVEEYQSRGGKITLLVDSEFDQQPGPNEADKFLMGE